MELCRRCSAPIQNCAQLCSQLVGLDRTVQGEDSAFVEKRSNGSGFANVSLSLRWASNTTRTMWDTCGPSKRRPISTDRNIR